MVRKVLVLFIQARLRPEAELLPSFRGLFRLAIGANCCINWSIQVGPIHPTGARCSAFLPLAWRECKEKVIDENTLFHLQPVLGSPGRTVSASLGPRSSGRAVTGWPEADRNARPAGQSSRSLPRADYRSFVVRLTELEPGDRFEVRVTWDDGTHRTVSRTVDSNPQSTILIDEPLHFDEAFGS